MQIHFQLCRAPGAEADSVEWAQRWIQLGHIEGWTGTLDELD